MRLPRMRFTVRRMMVAVAVVAVVLLVNGVCPAQTEGRRTFCGKTVDGWITALRDRSGRERRRAVRALAHLGPDAKAAVPDLIDALRRGDDLVIDALARIGPDAAPAVPLLAERFRKEDCFLAKQGSFGFSLFSGPKHALVRIGAASVPVLVAAMEDLDAERRPCAAEALGEIGPPARAAVPALIRALRLEHPKLDFNDLPSQALRTHAIIALGRIGPEARSALPALNSLLDISLERDDDDSFHIVLALDRISAAPVAKLLDFSRRKGVTGLLPWLGSKARAAVPDLRRALTDERVQVRVDAAEALASIDPSATEAVPVLIEALDHHPDEALGIPNALAKFGPAAASAIPSLLAQLTPETSDPDAIRALVQIDPEGRRCVPALIGALRQEDSDVVFAAAESLGLLGPRARDAVPALVAVTGSALGEGSANCNPRVSAIHGLGRIAPDAVELMPALIDALKCRKIEVQRPGLEGGFDAEKAVECDWSGVEAAAEVLGSLGPRARAAVPALIDLLRDRKKEDMLYTTTGAVALALGQIGPDARAAIPLLREAVEERTRYSGSAVVALAQLAPDGKGLAKKWLEKPPSGRVQVELIDDLEGRAMVYGAMGQPSLEADALIRSYLELLDWTIEGAEIEGYDFFPEWIIERLGRFGVGGRLAIPRLNELRRHRNPWMRQWAGEALARITKA